MFEKFLRKHFKHRLIRRSDNAPYLTRFYLFRRTKSWMPSVYVHCFHSSDNDQELHNHPWQRSVSFILKGSYLEEYKDKKDRVKTRILSPGKINIIQANKFHRVDLLNDKVWTLFISLNKQQRWGFWNRDTKQYYDFEEFEILKQKTALEQHMENIDNGEY